MGDAGVKRGSESQLPSRGPGSGPGVGMPLRHPRPGRHWSESRGEVGGHCSPRVGSGGREAGEGQDSGRIYGPRPPPTSNVQVSGAEQLELPDHILLNPVKFMA